MRVHELVSISVVLPNSVPKNLLMVYLIHMARVTRRGSGKRNPRVNRVRQYLKCIVILEYFKIEKLLDPVWSVGVGVGR